MDVERGDWLKDSKGLGRYLDMLKDQKFKSRGFFSPPVVDKLIEDHLSGRVDNSQVLWELINFEIWAQAFID